MAYIRRKDIEEMLESAYIVSDGEYCGYCTDDIDLYSIPTVDLVEVVHCKNCKYLMFSDFYGECSKGYMGIVSPDDYCSRGERKD